ncbi:carbohydrate ABC transporter permease [Anaeropeptidivorans aminofermentans]|jgi:multiple sugar transport system permease protein|uniref:carbohydrate ABC transporter permease n=1 Tax=Anaeropeptidivorans aminofermentans TaxID=2934315 RepID=UPI002023E258|nr:carbohydrate ABC transporter permease [Anaeropeptidivorans aminofermentans]MBE6011119.1 carbohydrate ABC transporter permease [Lachnospiraceae bacterium]
MKKKTVNITTYIALIAGSVITILPFIWMILTSFKTSGEIYAMPPSLLPKSFHLDNYSVVFNKIPLYTYLLNSIFIAACVTAATVITSVLAAYAFSNLKFPGRDLLFSMIIATMMVPSELLIIPNFVTLSKLGWIDTYYALIIPWTTSVFSIFFLRQFFLGIPKELYYAAKADGCSDFKYIVKVMVPIAQPAILTVAILKIIYSWNEFLWPLLVTNSEKLRTLPVGISSFITDSSVSHNHVSAYAVITILPIFILYLFFRKYIIAGSARSGIKG